MAFQNPGYKLPAHVAGSNLKDNQFYVVEVSGALEVDLASTGTTFPVGILQNDPDAGESAEVMVTGVSKAVTQDADIAAGDYITWDINGRVEKIGDTGNQIVMGIALEGTPATLSADLLITVLLLSVGDIDVT